MQNSAKIFLPKFLIFCTLLLTVACDSPENSILEPTPPDPLPENQQPTVAYQATIKASYSDEETGSCADEEKFCVGLVVDSSGVNDRAFNQAAWSGVQRSIVDLNAKVDFRESTHPAQFGNNIRHFAEQDYDIIVTVGFDMRQSTLAIASEFPNTHFVGVDQHQFVAEDNVTGLIFSEREAGYLAGVLGAMLTDTNTAGLILGSQHVDANAAYEAGFKTGFLAVNPEAQFFSEFYSTADGQSETQKSWSAHTAETMMDEGADIIFAAGGKVVANALIEGNQNQDVFCIGADTDQWQVIPEARNCIISSATKDIEQGVFILIALALIGDAPSGNYEGDVRLAPFHTYEKHITPDVQAFLDDLTSDIESGEVSIFAADFQFEKSPTIEIQR